MQTCIGPPFPRPHAGLPSQVREVQSLCLDTTTKLIKAAGPELVRPHLTALVPILLESLRWGLAGMCRLLAIFFLFLAFCNPKVLALFHNSVYITSSASLKTMAPFV
jgi:hypothetical protein